METVLPPVYTKRVGRRRKKRFRRQSRKTAKRQRLDEEELDAILKGEFDCCEEDADLDGGEQELHYQEEETMEALNFDIHVSGLSPLDELLQY
ncbi:hypothetical protein P9112_009534 [Eukaryota sp. TZLM1-RC]